MARINYLGDTISARCINALSRLGYLVTNPNVHWRVYGELELRT